MDAEIYRVKETTSTQDLAIELIQNQQRSPQEMWAVIADTQTLGKGRKGRVWLDNSKSMLTSINIPRVQLQKHIPQISVVVAVQKTLQKIQSDKIKIKWPNDFLNSQNQKIGGILIYEQPQSFICGIGINCAGVEKLQNSRFIKQEVGSIQADPIELLDNILAHLKVIPKETSAESLAYYNSKMAYLDQKVEFKKVGSNLFVPGKLIGTNKEGLLLLETLDGMIELSSIDEIRLIN